MNNKLPVIDIFLEALSLPYKHYRMLLKVALPVITVWLAIFALNLVFTGPNKGSVQTALIITSAIAFAISLVMTTIGCHRIFLLGDSPINSESLFHWTGNEFKYIGWWLLITLCTILIAIPCMFILTPFISSIVENSFDSPAIIVALISLIYIPIFYVASRWSLLLPSAAISKHGKNLLWSWELSSGNGWRLAVLIGFLPFTTDLLFELLPAHNSIALSLLEGFLWLVVYIIEVGALSLSYKFLCDHDEKSPANELRC